MTNAETIRRAMSLLGSRNTEAQQRARRANAAKLNAGKPRYSPEEKRERAAARMRAYRAGRKFEQNLES